MSVCQLMDGNALTEELNLSENLFLYYHCNLGTDRLFTNYDRKMCYDGKNPQLHVHNKFDINYR